MNESNKMGWEGKLGSVPKHFVQFNAAAGLFLCPMDEGTGDSFVLPAGPGNRDRGP